MYVYIIVFAISTTLGQKKILNVSPLQPRLRKVG